MKKSKPSTPTWLAVYVYWIGLTIAAVWVGMQWNGAILALAAWVISKPGLRPTGWTNATLPSINRISVLILGALWLMGILFTENILRSAALEHRLLRQSALLALILLLIWLGSVALPLVLF